MLAHVKHLCPYKLGLWLGAKSASVGGGRGKGSGKGILVAKKLVLKRPGWYLGPKCGTMFCMDTTKTRQPKTQAQDAAIEAAGFTGPRAKKARPFLCRGCGLLFSGEAVFKAHRYGEFIDVHPHYGRACHDEDWLRANGYERNEKSWWYKPMTEEQRAQLERLKGARQLWEMLYG